MHYNYYKTHLFENSVLYFFIQTKNRDIQMYLCSKYWYTGCIYICGTGLCHAKIDDLTHLELIRKENY